MDGPRDYHTKQSKSGRERYKSYSITYMWNPKSKTNDQTKQKRYIDTENKLMVAGVGVQGWLKKAMWIRGIILHLI